MSFVPCTPLSPPRRRRVATHPRLRPALVHCASSSAHATDAKVHLKADGTGPFGRGATSHERQVSALDADGEPRLHVVFVHPRIHWNTGNMGRTCLGLGARLHLVGPLGFSLDERQVRRAGLDYWEHVDLRVHERWGVFAEEVLPGLGERFYFTKYAGRSILDVEFPRRGKVVLIFGSETDGLTGIEEELPEGELERHGVAFPMRSTEVFRSFNLSTSASIGLWEAYRQILASP